MGFVISTGVSFVTEECIECGILFAVTEEYNKRRRADHKSFKCPSGHSQYYPQKSDKEKLREQLTRTKNELDYAETRIKQEKERNEHLKKSRAAVKGQLTKTKNRISKGVCPCCNRTFQNLMGHMKTQHPDYTEAK